MDIGILTFHRALNYGAALQAYALSRHLRRLGHNAELIDFVPEGHVVNSRILFPPTNLRNIKRDYLYLRCSEYLRNRSSAFNDFQELIGLSKMRSIDRIGLSNVLRNYDAVVCGSDQIWNPLLVDSDIGYFAPGGNDLIRIAYAVSLGRGKLEEYEDDDSIKSMILRFNAISFRERGSLDKARDFVSLPEGCTVVSDPTLLDGRQVFDEIALPKTIETGFIFVYSVAARRETFDAAKELSRRTGLPYFTLFSGRPARSWISESKHLPKGDVGPKAFLSMIRDAEWCVTDSYHGTVLSSLYGTRCLTVSRRDPDGSVVKDARFEELYSQFQSLNESVLPESISTISLDEIQPLASVFEAERKEMGKSSSEWLQRALACS